MCPDRVEVGQRHEQLCHCPIQGEAGDPQLHRLRIANLAMAIANGDRVAAHELGVLAIQQVLGGRI